MELFIEKYGLGIAFAIYIFYEKFLPIITQKWIPGKLRQIEEERKAKQQIEEDERKTRLQQEADDRQWRIDMEKEHQLAIKQIAASTQTLTLSMTQTNERIATIMNNQQLIMYKQDQVGEKLDKTDSFIRSAVGDMRETLAAETGRRTKKTPTGPLHDKPASTSRS